MGNLSEQFISGMAITVLGKHLPARTAILRKLGVFVTPGLLALSLIPTDKITISGCMPSVSAGCIIICSRFLILAPGQLSNWMSRSVDSVILETFESPRMTTRLEIFGNLQPDFLQFVLLCTDGTVENRRAVLGVGVSL